MDLLLANEKELAAALAGLAQRYPLEPDIGPPGTLLATWSEEHIRILAAHSGRAPAGASIARLPSAAGSEGASLLLDLQRTWCLAQEVHLGWTVLGQAARALRDHTLAGICAALGQETDRQLAWLRTRIEAIAPQLLIAGP